jgi:hypothetical protein
MQTKKDIVKEYLSIEANANKQTKVQLQELEAIGCTINRTMLLKYRKELATPLTTPVNETVNETPVNETVNETPVNETVNETPVNETVNETPVSDNSIFNTFKDLTKKNVASYVLMGLFQPLMAELDATNNIKRMDETLELLDLLDNDDYFKRCGFNFKQSFWNTFDVNKGHYENLAKHYKKTN